VKKGANKTITSYWLLVISCVVLVGLAATIYSGAVAGQNMKNTLLQRSDSLAELLDTDQIQSLSGTETDINSPRYQELKQHFQNLRELNPDIRFAYLLGQSSERPDSYFLLDSEPISSEDYSYPGQPYPEGNQDVANLYTSGEGEILPITKDRWGYWLSAFSPIKNAQGTVIAVFGVDTAASTYYSRILLTSLVPLLLTALVVGLLLWLRRRAIYQQQYLTEKAFFLSFASHEIRSPLTSVSWAIQAIMNKSIPPERSSIFLERANQSIHNILSTVEDVLSLQRTEGLAMKNLNLSNEAIHPLLKFSIEGLSLTSTEKECAIIDDTDPTDYSLTGQVDVPLFKRVLSNLLVNAMKYSPKGAPVTVKLYPSGSGWSIAVHNGGDPISASDQAKIFEGFYRTDSAEKGNQHGSGLGLMLCLDIIQRHGGKLELESSPEAGTTFRINMSHQDSQKAL
jgi:signal transduction histidine kinase